MIVVIFVYNSTLLYPIFNWFEYNHYHLCIRQYSIFINSSLDKIYFLISTCLHLNVFYFNIVFLCRLLFQPWIQSYYLSLETGIQHSNKSHNTTSYILLFTLIPIFYYNIHSLILFAFIQNNNYHYFFLKIFIYKKITVVKNTYF